MNLGEKIESDYIAAYKGKNAIQLSVLRLLKTAAKNLQVELRRPPDEGELMDLVIKQCKQRQDSIEQFTAAGRLDLADKESAEMAVLRAYLPEPLEGEALKEAAESAIAELNAASPKDMGRVIQHLMAAYKGRVDGKAVSAVVKECLSS